MRAAGRRLAAAALPDQADRLAGVDVEVDALDGLDLADVSGAGSLDWIGKYFCRPRTCRTTSPTGVPALRAPASVRFGVVTRPPRPVAFDGQGALLVKGAGSSGRRGPR